MDVNRRFLPWDGSCDILGCDVGMESPTMRGKATALSSDCCCAPVDVTENKEAYDLCAEVPGLSEKDVKVEWLGTTLCIEGTPDTAGTKGEGTLHWSERCHGSTGRCFTFPDEIDANKASARMKNGVLCVHVPKAEVAKPKMVEVKAE